MAGELWETPARGSNSASTIAQRLAFRTARTLLSSPTVKPEGGAEESVARAPAPTPVGVASSVLCWLAVLFELTVLPAHALDPRRAITQYVHDVWQAKDGLPQNAVQAIVQTRDGYLWLGTQAGLARFDGVRFVVFDKSNTAAMRSDNVRALLEDREGGLWIGTYGGGLLRLKDGRFEPWTAREGLDHDVIYTLYQDRQGEIWIGTGGGGLYRLRNGRFTALTTKDGLSDNRAYAICEDREGSLWVATYGGGLNRLRDGRFTRYGKREGLASDILSALYEDRRGNLWVGTYGGGLAVRRGERFVTYTTRDGLPDDSVFSLLEDRDGSLWIGTYNGGLARLADGEFSTYREKDGLSSDYLLWRIFEDREGSLWVGTAGGGLNRFRDGAFATYGTPEGLSGNVAWSVHEGKAGEIWVGTEGAGANRLQGGKVTVFRKANGLPSDAVDGVYVDRQGSVWFATWGAGIARLANGVFTTYTTRDGLPSLMTMGFFEDRAGRLWVNAYGGGFVRFESDGRLVPMAAPGAPAAWANRTFEDRQGSLWIGTNGSGLYRLRDGQWTIFSEKDGLGSGVVLGLYEDPSGSLWIGTRGGGLSRLRDGKLTTYTSRDGLPSDTIGDIVDDLLGYLWMSSPKGVVRVSRKELDAFVPGSKPPLGLRLFDVSDGMRDSQCNAGAQPSAWRSRDGRIWFPTVKGVGVVDPSDLKPNPVAPAVRIEEVVADGRPLSTETALALPAGTQRVEFRYTALSLRNPDRVRFRQMLVGFDRGWVDAGTRRTSSYTNLPAGDHELRIVASNDDGVWNEQGASFRFRVEPRYYETPVFGFLAVLGLVLVGVGLHRARVWRLEARQRELTVRIEEAVAKVKVLSGLLPVCAWCRKVRDDEGYWKQIETYIASHSDTRFTHGICPDCSEKQQGSDPPVEVRTEG